MAELFDGGIYFLPFNVLVPLVVVLNFRALPRQGTTNEVEQNISERLKIIPTSLPYPSISYCWTFLWSIIIPTYAQIIVNTYKVARAFQRAIVLIRYMNLALRISVFPRKVEIDYVYQIALLATSYHKVVWLDIAIYDESCVYMLDTCK